MLPNSCAGDTRYRTRPAVLSCVLFWATLGIALTVFYALPCGDKEFAGWIFLRRSRTFRYRVLPAARILRRVLPEHVEEIRWVRRAAHCLNRHLAPKEGHP